MRDQSCGTDNGQFRLAPSDSVMKCVGFAGSFTAIATVSGQLAHHSSQLCERGDTLDFEDSCEDELYTLVRLKSHRIKTCYLLQLPGGLMISFPNNLIHMDSNPLLLKA